MIASLNGRVPSSSSYEPMGVSCKYPSGGPAGTARFSLLF